jgi:hypothetical protein
MPLRAQSFSGTDMSVGHRGEGRLRRAFTWRQADHVDEARERQK